MTTTEAWSKAFIGEWLDQNKEATTIRSRLQRLLDDETGYLAIWTAIEAAEFPHQIANGIVKNVRYLLTWENSPVRPFECSMCYYWWLELRENGSLMLSKETKYACSCHGKTELNWDKPVKLY